MIDVGPFRIRAFNAALVVNFLAIFVMVGYFLFIGQYLQLVVGLSPLQAGLWSVPSAAGFIAGSQLAPRYLQRAQPAYVVAGGLAAEALGLFVLTMVQVAHGLFALVVASVVVSLGMGPVFGLTTEMVVG
jgi:MFS transporter, DHA2 family, multidrug resistance protein